MRSVSAQRRRRSAAVGAVLCSLALTGCGTDLSPGVAATVDGESISQGKVDDVVTAACSYIHAQNETSGGEPLAMSSLRSSITGALVQFKLTEAISDKLGLTIYPATVQSIASQNPLPDTLSKSDQATLKDFFYDSAKSQVEQAVIGAHLDDPSVTTSRKINASSQQKGAAYVTKQSADSDVTVNPGYGTWDKGVIEIASGSLSDPVSAMAKAGEPGADGEVSTADLPASQICV